ncbi:MAG: photosynthetic reaction center cytochrome c subunit family protein [Pyrinomonadaceae bacterium]
MKSLLKLSVVATMAGVAFALLLATPGGGLLTDGRVLAQAAPSPPTFDQAAALAKLREQIKGREQEPASKVFKNVTMPMFKDAPAGRLLAVMEFGYARSLGVNCTHCHMPEKWESEDKPQKQIARDMQAMVFKISGEILTGIKHLRSEQPTINCTTCHRGEIKPALNLPTR